MTTFYVKKFEELSQSGVHQPIRKMITTKEKKTVSLFRAFLFVESMDSNWNSMLPTCSLIFPRQCNHNHLRKNVRKLPIIDNGTNEHKRGYSHDDGIFNPLDQILG